jgi:hypothetical protein
MATAVFIRSESADYYLYCTEENLNNDEALKWAESKCDEEREYWCDWMVTQSD